MKTPKVENMTSPRTGRAIANQFVLKTSEGKYFQSYAAMIAFVPYNCDFKILLDQAYYDYSRTTVKYRNQFLGLTTKEIEAKIKTGEILLVDLNK